MPKAVGRPTLKPKRVTLSLAAHHAAELERLAEAHDVKLSTFCANLLERYSLEKQGTLASDILKTAVVETVQREMGEHHNRVRSLFARTALESIATRQLARMTLQALLRENKADTYNEQAWEYAVHVLKNPTPAIREAIGQLSESISQDDPALMVKVRETNEEVSAALAEVKRLTDHLQKLTDHQTQIVRVLNTATEKLIQVENQLKDNQRDSQNVARRLGTLEELAQSRKGRLF